jgi:hypothetical protein
MCLCLYCARGRATDRRILEGERNSHVERQERKLRNVKIKDSDSLGAFDQRIGRKPNPSFFSSTHS